MQVSTSELQPVLCNRTPSAAQQMLHRSSVMSRPALCRPMGMLAMEHAWRMALPWRSTLRPASEHRMAFL